MGNILGELFGLLPYAGAAAGGYLEGRQMNDKRQSDQAAQQFKQDQDARDRKEFMMKLGLDEDRLAFDRDRMAKNDENTDAMRMLRELLGQGNLDARNRGEDNKMTRHVTPSGSTKATNERMLAPKPVDPLARTKAIQKLLSERADLVKAKKYRVTRSGKADIDTEIANINAEIEAMKNTGELQPDEVTSALPPSRLQLKINAAPIKK